MKDKVAVELDIGEIMVLIDWHYEFVNSIPESRYDQMTMAGHTLGVTVQKHKERIRELRNLKDETWPK